VGERDRQLAERELAACGLVAALVEVRAMNDPEHCGRVVLDLEPETDVVAISKVAASLVEKCSDGRDVLRRIALAVADSAADIPRRPALGAYRREGGRAE
jgi:hypothetical protein